MLVGGFAAGELAAKLGLPKVTGYIAGGVLLNPGLLGFVPARLLDQTAPVTNMALAFITFSVGGTVFLPRVRKLGRSIALITLFEAQFAFLAVVIGFAALAPLLLPGTDLHWSTAVLPMSLLAGSLASPTDPSATLAVAHEYRARGPVSSTIMSVAAFDDALGIINYSIAVAAAAALARQTGFQVGSSLLAPLLSIAGAAVIGVAFGFVLNGTTRLFRWETEGAIIVPILGLLAACFGVARLVRVDELLATMTMGIMVVNTNPRRVRIFGVLERYTEQLVFVLFFTLSGMHLKFPALFAAFGLVLLFVLLRALGKFSGTALGALLGRAPSKVRRYAAGGLIPQGGIVIGLALLMKQNPAFDAFSDILISLVIGTAVIHELVGPMLAKRALKKAGELGGQEGEGNSDE